MTKPAAQEPQYNCAHHGIQRGSYCIKCGAICVPATPTPSQPAAREWKRQESCPECDGDGCAACLADVDEWFRVNRPKLHDAVKYAAGEKGKAFDIIVFEACDAYARQQTAAKDAEIRELTFVKDVWVETGENYKTLLEAAERERDSLREALTEVLSRLPDEETIEALKADKGYGYRQYPMEPTPRDSDIVRWRVALKAGKE